MVWFLIIDIFLLAVVGLAIWKRGLNVSFLVSALVIAAWYFYGSLGYYDALGLVAVPLLLFCLVYLASVFIQWALLRIFPKKDRAGASRTEDEDELLRRYSRASAEDRKIIDMLLEKYAGGRGKR